jgi:transposase
MIRMLIVGCCFGIRSERRLYEEVHLNLAYRWICQLGLDGAVPDHSHKAVFAVDADVVLVPEHRHRDLRLALMALV